MMMTSAPPNTLRRTLAATIASLAVGASAQSLPNQTEVQFRGCDTAGWCRFRIETSIYAEETVLRVRPDGVRFDASSAVALRDRLNALLVDMIHQYKRIELHGLRALESNVYAAKVIVDGTDVSDDAVVQKLVR